MKILKIIIATFALSAAVVTTAQAHDSFSIGINIGGHDYAPHSVHTHRHAPAYYVYYGAPTVYYSQPVRDHYYSGRGYSGYRNDGHHYRQHGDRHYRGQDRRGNSRGHDRH